MADFFLTFTRGSGRESVVQGPDRSGRAGRIWRRRVGPSGRVSLERLESRSPRPVDVAEGPEGGLYVLFGEPWNADRLRRQLDVRARGPAALLAAGWHREGPSFAAKLRGPVAGATWEPAAGRLATFRDKFGQVPLFFYDSNGCIAVSGSPRTLLARIDDDFWINRARLAALLAQSHDVARDYVFEGLHRVRPREVLEWEVPGFERRSRVYWRPETRVGREETPAPERIRSILFDVVESLPATPRVHALSGGLDSSTLVAIDKRLGSRGAPSVVTASMTARRFPRADESEWIGEASRAMGVRNDTYDISDHVPLTDGTFEDPFVEWGPMYLYDETWWKGFLPFILERTRRRAVVLGVGGDRLFGVPRKPLWDAYRRHGQWLKFADATRQGFGQGGAGLAARSLADGLPDSDVLSALRRRRHHRKYPWRYPQQWIRPVDGWQGVSLSELHGRSGVDPDYPLTGRLLNNATWELEKMYVSVERRGRRRGVRFWNPFLDGRLWEACMSTPVWDLRDATANKLQLRCALDGLLPDKIRCADAHTNYRPLTELGLARRGRRRVESLGSDSRLVELGVLDRQAFLKAYRAYVRHVDSDEQSPAIGYHLWAVVATERWIRAVEEARPF